MINAHNVIIGGVEVSFDASHELSQTYEPLSARSVLRMSNGAAHLQTLWTGKLRSTLTGAGRLPDGLSALDYSAPIEIDCLAPRSIWTSSTSLVLPAARRSDFAPIGWAVKNGNMIRTGVNLSGDVLTFSQVPGSSGYVAGYYPKIQCYATEPVIRFDGRSPMSYWVLTAEEI
jgi:hypothetical protein